MKYRQATRDDVPRIMEIIGQAQAQMRALGSDQWQDGYPAHGDIEGDIAAQYGMIAHDDTSVIGYAAVVFDGEPAYAQIDGAWLSADDYVVVHRLAVADEAKQQGVATEVMRHVELLARTRGCGSFRIDTAEDNHYMQRMIARLDFQFCGIIHYASGVRWAYEKSLK